MDNTLTKKVIGNAFSAYFLFFVCITFLWNKNPDINHPFVKKHAKTAFSLHILLLIILFIMGFDVGSSISLFGITDLNEVVTIVLSIGVFSALFYGAYTAFNGNSLTINEIFHKTGVQKKLLQVQKIEENHEEQSTFLILAHVPFFGFIISGQHPTLPHIRDIAMLHLISMLLMVLLYITGFVSLANIIFLVYIIWSAIQSLRLVFQDELGTLHTSYIPSPTELHIVLKSFFSYMLSTLHSQKVFTPLQDIILKNTQKNAEQKVQDMLSLENLTPSKIPHLLFYIPLVNIIGVFSLRTQQKFHIENGIILSVFFIITLILFGYKTPLVLFFLFPIFFGIGKLRDPSYKMPFIHDIFRVGSTILYYITHIFRKTRELKNKQIKETTIIGETKSEEKTEA